MTLKKQFLNFNPIAHIRRRIERSRLVSNVSILASNCIGGLLYHDLGKQFMSPTVNTRFSSPDFVKFVCHLEHYLEKTLDFMDTDDGFPVAMLDDVRICFVHYKTRRDAEHKWEERKKRIDFSRIFVLLNDNDGMKDSDYRALDQCAFQNICVFTAQDKTEYRCAFQLREFAGKNEIGNSLKRSWLTGEMLAQRSFDFVAWFNQERGTELECYRR